MFDIPCVIFAGGKSSRMGEDKALLPFGGFDTLTQFQLHRLSKLFKNVYISCKDKSKFDFLNEKITFIEDIKSDNIYAPTFGFLAVFESLGCERFFALSVDTPFVSEDEITRIIESDTQEAQATIAKSISGMHPMCGIYHNSLEEKFVDMLKNDTHKLGFLLKNSNINIVDFEDDMPFLNINHPHEYKQALTKISD